MNTTPPRVLRWPFVVAGALVGLLPIGIAIWGYVQGYRSVNDESVDPSQKARLLADSLTTATNGLATAVVLVPLGAALILYGVMRRRPKPQLPQPKT